MSTERRILGPFNRVEGDLDIKVEVLDNRVQRAWVNAPLFRGFEQILSDKDPRDALVYTPRICGICSVSQSVAAATAIANAQGISPAPNGLLATNLILATENLADHLSHFYLFFMPDFARSGYQHKPWFESIADRFRAQQGSAAHQALEARSEFLNLTGILAGKWPHSLAIQPGGTTRSIQENELIRMLSIIRSMRYFLESVTFSDSLEALSCLQTQGDLENWQATHSNSDFARFLNVAKDLQLSHLGRTQNRFLSYGAYPMGETTLFPAGIWDNGPEMLDQQNILEDVSSSWLTGAISEHPYKGSTVIDEQMRNGYSWCKAPRYDGRVLEVGALARQMVAGHPLIRDLVNHNGASVYTRVVARLLEIALLIPQMEQWLAQIKTGDAFCESQTIPDEAQGAGLVEAARGSLGHWLVIKKGRIFNYQIVAPTTWNFSPRDHQDQAGALEQALVGIEIVDNIENTLSIQHVIRSFDPCMVCTVH